MENKTTGQERQAVYAEARRKWWAMICRVLDARLDDLQASKQAATTKSKETSQ